MGEARVRQLHVSNKRRNCSTPLQQCLGRGCVAIVESRRPRLLAWTLGHGMLAAGGGNRQPDTVAPKRAHRSDSRPARRKHDIQKLRQPRKNGWGLFRSRSKLSGDIGVVM